MLQDVVEYMRSLSTAEFDIVESDVTCTVNKNTIYLLLRDTNGKYFDWHTIISAAIHELAHVIDRVNGHSGTFFVILRHLEAIASAKYGYICSFPTDPEYSRVCEK